MEARTGFKLLAFVFLIILIAGMAIGGWEATPDIEAAGGELPGWTKDVFRIIFGAKLPNEMFYVYTIVPYLIVPFFGAFILIYFLVEQIGTIPAKFAAPLAIVVTLIACVSGIFVKMVFALLFAFGFYGFLLVWVVLILSGSIWGLGTIGEKFGALSGIMKKYEKKFEDVDKELEKARAECVHYHNISREHEGTPEGREAFHKAYELTRKIRGLERERSELGRKEAREKIKQRPG